MGGDILRGLVSSVDCMYAASVPCTLRGDWRCSWLGWSGVEWTGVEWSGVKWSGVNEGASEVEWVEWNGVEWVR